MARRLCCIKREKYFWHMHFSSYLDICLDLSQNCSFYSSITFFLQPRVSMKIVFDKIIIHFWINFEKKGNYFPNNCTQVHRWQNDLHFLHMKLCQSIKRGLQVNSQFYIQLVNRPHFRTGILLFGPFGQSGQKEKK